MQSPYRDYIYTVGTEIRIDHLKPLYHLQYEGQHIMFDLKKGVFGYKMVPVDVPEAFESFQVKYTRTGKFRGKIPITFEVKFSYSNNGQTFNPNPMKLTEANRCSRTQYYTGESNQRYCHIWEYSGYHEQRIIFLLGAKNSGKSCFKHSCQTPLTGTRLKELLPGRITFLEKDYVSEQIPPTELSTINHVCFRISPTGDPKDEIDIFLVDIAGEFCIDRDLLDGQVQSERDGQDQNGQRDQFMKDEIMKSIETLADGVLVITNYKNYIDPRSRSAYLIGSDGDPMRIMKELEDDGKLPENVAYVAVGSDVIQDKLENGEGDLNFGVNIPKNCSLFREAEPAREDKSPLDRMFRHMAMAYSAMRTPLSQLDNYAPCFMVSSLNVMADGRFDFTKAVNVSLPLAYMIIQTAGLAKEV